MWNGKHLGTIGNVGSFSFQQSKLIASGEGGCCITNDEELSEKIGRISHIGYRYGAKQGEKVDPPAIGMICFNYRVTDFQAVILLSQLEHLEEDTKRRAENAEYLRAKLNAIPGVRVQAAGRKATLQSYYQFCIIIDHKRLKDGITRTEVLDALYAEGARCIDNGWGNIIYKQKYWTLPEDKYRVHSSAAAEEIVTKELICCDLKVLMMSKDFMDNFVRCFEKVMGEYCR